MSARRTTPKEATVPDRRSITSRRNLGDFVPDPIDPKGSVKVSARVPQALAKRIEKARGTTTASEYLRALLDQHVPC